MSEAEFRAFHGTLERNLEAILEEGVRPSHNDDEWLGDGSYFFTDGLMDPRRAAMDWASWIRWATRRDSRHPGLIAVVEVKITTIRQHALDLRSALQAALYHDRRREWLVKQYGHPVPTVDRPNRRSFDTAYLNHLKREAGLAAVVADVHIALSPQERFFRAESRIPNVSVLCLTPGPLIGTRVTTTAVEVVDPSYSI